MYDDPKQPILTSHAQRRNGPTRGKQHYDVRNDRRPQRDNGDRPQFDKSRKQSRPRPQGKPGFDHDQMIQAFKGADIDLLFLNGEGVTGKLIDGDRYALVVDTADGREIVYKSSLQSIGLPTPKKPRGQ